MPCVTNVSVIKSPVNKSPVIKSPVIKSPACSPFDHLFSKLRKVMTSWQPKPNDPEELNPKVVDFITVSKKDTDKWEIPPEIQRPLKVNTKVIAVAQALPLTKKLEGTITLGFWDGVVWILDGQHRLAAFILAQEKYGLADRVNILCHIEVFATRAAMAARFRLLQQSLLKMSPDDGLRPMAINTPSLQILTRECPFIGFGNIQRLFQTSQTLSMSVLLRCWHGSSFESPSLSNSSMSEYALSMSEAEACECASFLKLAFQVWARIPEYARLWGILNITLCMWFYRRMVLEPASGITKLNPDQFRVWLGCLFEDPLSIPRAQEKMNWISPYRDWLIGKAMNIETRRIAAQQIKLRALKFLPARTKHPAKVRKLKFPSAPWMSPPTKN
jgi:hypothetical protein